MRLVLEDSGFGSEPDLETQRFVPELHQTHGFPHFSLRECGRVRSRRGARIEPASPIRLDLQNSGASCYRSDTTGIVISLGLTPGSRKTRGCRPTSLAGAAHGSGNDVTWSTLSLLSRTVRNIDRTESSACQGIISGSEAVVPHPPFGHPLPSKGTGEGHNNEPSPVSSNGRRWPKAG